MAEIEMTSPQPRNKGSKSPLATMMGARVAAMLRNVMRDLRKPYRPEQHYMRGPGPKWHEKHPA
jgi:hypothetical protein